mmetsp:Transcript_62038/g.196140  ORF Transcript_62038/g.196140 Transcript_62038/m.196140 type:complete len:228 (+) Transcript_62038:214-897(+)
MRSEPFPILHHAARARSAHGVRDRAQVPRQSPPRVDLAREHSLLHCRARPPISIKVSLALHGFLDGGWHRPGVLRLHRLQHPLQPAQRLLQPRPQLGHPAGRLIQLLPQLLWERLDDHRGRRGGGGGIGGVLGGAHGLQLPQHLFLYHGRHLGAVLRCALGQGAQLREESQRLGVLEDGPAHLKLWVAVFIARPGLRVHDDVVLELVDHAPRHLRQVRGEDLGLLIG